MEILDRIEAEVRDLPKHAPSDDRETADFVGRLDKIIRSLGDHKKALLAEMAGPATGAAYKVTEQNRAQRSYNTAAILSRFGAQGVELSELVRSDVARIQWQWTNLKRAAYANGIEMRVASGEIENSGDVDGPLVGEVWQSYQKIESA